MSQKICVVTAALLFLAALTVPASLLWAQGRTGAPEWPQWRGPDRTGKSVETGLLKQWPEGGPPKVWTITGPCLSAVNGFAAKDRIAPVQSSLSAQATVSYAFPPRSLTALVWPI